MNLVSNYFVGVVVSRETHEVPAATIGRRARGRPGQTVQSRLVVQVCHALTGATGCFGLSFFNVLFCLFLIVSHQHDRVLRYLTLRVLPGSTDLLVLLGSPGCSAAIGV